MPKKPTKWGMKAWLLADSRTGYTWNWNLYAGKEDGDTDDSLGTRVVLQLVEDPSTMPTSITFTPLLVIHNNICT